MSHHRRVTKVFVIGAGNVCMAITRDRADETALVDGEMLDLQHAAASLPRTRLVSDTGIAVTKGSDLAIAAVGARLIPRETRLKLLQRNVALLRKIDPPLAEHSREALQLIVSNPVDVLTYVASKLLGFIGSGTNFDSSRFSLLLADHLDINAQDVQDYHNYKSHQTASNPLPKDGPTKALSVKRPVAVGQEMAIQDDGGAFVGPGMAGDVSGRGADMTRGYKTNPEPAVIIVGAGRSGLAMAACLRTQGVPFLVLEKADRIAPFWQNRTNHSLKVLKLLFPDRFGALPLMPFPDGYPEYPTGSHYIEHLEGYAATFDIKPEFNCKVKSAHYDEASGLWRVCVSAAATGVAEREYVGRWLVVATGENDHRVVPDIPGLGSFAGEVTHVGEYKSGEAYRGKKVLVVGSGSSSGVEVALDLFDHGARPVVVARDAVDGVLPREVFGEPTLELTIKYLKPLLPVRLVDKAMALLGRAVLGDFAKLAVRRLAVRTPVFDFSDLGDGDIGVVPAVVRFDGGKAEFMDGRALDIDAVVLATGYCSNVPQAKWRRERSRYPATAFPYGWDGHSGLYAVGFTRHSFGGASMDAERVAEDIAAAWRRRAWREGGEPSAEPSADRERDGTTVTF